MATTRRGTAWRSVGLHHSATHRGSLALAIDSLALTHPADHSDVVQGSAGQMAGRMSCSHNHHTTTQRC